MLQTTHLVWQGRNFLQHLENEKKSDTIYGICENVAMEE